MSALPSPWTVEAFLAWEREQQERYEFVDGVIRPMTGQSIAHAVVKGNLFVALRASVKMPCRVLLDGPKLVTAAASLYPDVLVTCAPVAMANDAVREPKLIAEVLSRPTAHHDRGAKWLAYREIASLVYYLLIWQDALRVELFSRKGIGVWELAVLEPPAPLRLKALGVELDIGRLYEGMLGQD